MFIPAVVMSGYLFHGVQAFCVRCSNILWLLLFMFFSIWCPSIVIDGRASSDQSPGPILVNIRWFLCLCLVWVLWVRCCCIVLLHRVCGTWCMHCVRVIFNVFLVSLLLYDSGRKVIIIIFYHNNCHPGFNWPWSNGAIAHCYIFTSFQKVIPVKFLSCL